MGDTEGPRYTAPKISAISYLFGNFSLLIMGDTEWPRYTGFRGLSVRGITALQCIYDEVKVHSKLEEFKSLLKGQTFLQKRTGFPGIWTDPIYNVFLFIFFFFPREKFAPLWNSQRGPTCIYCCQKRCGAPVAQLVKHWPTNLVVPGLSTAWGGNLSNLKQGSIAHSISLSPKQCHDMTGILLKRA